MTGPSYKDLKENFDKFSEESKNLEEKIENSSNNLNENTLLRVQKGRMTAWEAGDAYGNKLLQRRLGLAAEIKENQKKLEYFLYLMNGGGKHGGFSGGGLKHAMKGPLKHSEGGEYRYTLAYHTGVGGPFGVHKGKTRKRAEAINAFMNVYTVQKAVNTVTGGIELSVAYLKSALLPELKKDLNHAQKRMAGGAVPHTSLGGKYFSRDLGYKWGRGSKMDPEDTREYYAENFTSNQQIWTALVDRIKSKIRGVQTIIKEVSKGYSALKSQIEVTKAALEAGRPELLMIQKAVVAAEDEYQRAIKHDTPALEAQKRGSDVAKKIMAGHKPKPAAVTPPAPTPAAKPKAAAPKPAYTAQSKKVTDIFENDKSVLQETSAEVGEMQDDLIAARNAAVAEMQARRSPDPVPVRKVVARLLTYIDSNCPEGNVSMSPACKQARSLLQIAKTDLADIKKYRKEREKESEKKAPSQDMGKGRRTAKGKTSMRRRRRQKKKERCGKAPKGEYGSARFKPKPRRLGGGKWSKRKTQAVQEKHPETKKIFDQFYADLDEFGVKITKDFWWGSAHDKAYRKILCKLDEKIAKSIEDADEVDYKLANKYNANRQRLGLPILTGDQLKKEYLSTLIRGGMHMGLSHEESDKLIGKRKGTAPVKKKPEKPKAVSGVEATEAVEDANAIYRMAKGWTDGEEEQRITAIVEKHLRKNTIGILSNYYVRVLRQNNAMDRGDLVRELYEEDLTDLARRVQQALQRQTRGQRFREGRVIPAKNRVVYGGKLFNLNKLVEHASKGLIKNFKDLKYAIRKKAIVESKNSRAVRSTEVASTWVMNWLEENVGIK